MGIDAEIKRKGKFKLSSKRKRKKEKLSSNVGSENGIGYKELKEIEKNKSKYMKNDDDSLFTIISKAIVREGYPRIFDKNIIFKNNKK